MMDEEKFLMQLGMDDGDEPDDGGDDENEDGDDGWGDW